MAGDRIAGSAALADNIRRVRQLGYKEIILLGHSAGGVIVRQFVEDHPDAGVTVLHREEAIVERVMLERAARVAVLAAAGKLGSGGPYVVGPAEAVDVLVTDAADTAELEARGIGVVRA